MLRRSVIKAAVALALAGMVWLAWVAPGLRAIYASPTNLQNPNGFALVVLAGAPADVAFGARIEVPPLQVGSPAVLAIGVSGGPPDGSRMTLVLGGEFLHSFLYCDDPTISVDRTVGFEDMQADERLAVHQFTTLAAEGWPGPALRSRLSDWGEPQSRGAPAPRLDAAGELADSGDPTGGNYDPTDVISGYLSEATIGTLNLPEGGGDVAMSAPDAAGNSGALGWDYTFRCLFDSAHFWTDNSPEYLFTMPAIGYSIPESEAALDSMFTEVDARVGTDLVVLRAAPEPNEESRETVIWEMSSNTQVKTAGRGRVTVASPPIASVLKSNEIDQVTKGRIFFAGVGLSAAASLAVAALGLLADPVLDILAAKRNSRKGHERPGR